MGEINNFVETVRQLSVGGMRGRSQGWRRKAEEAQREKQKVLESKRVAEVGGKVTWQMFRHHLTSSGCFHGNNNLMFLSCRNRASEDAVGSFALFGRKMPPERYVEGWEILERWDKWCLGTRRRNNDGTLLQNKPLKVCLLSII